jgi:hypothetical protein
VKKLIILVVLAAFYFPAISQDRSKEKSKADTRREERRKKINELIRQDEEGVLIYTKQTIFGLHLRTNGYGLFFEKGKSKSPTISTIFDIEFNEIKHRKEDKLPNGTGGISFGNPYIYGKLNNFYQFQLGLGQQRILGQKGNKNGVAVSMIYKGGLSMGLLRPYYIDVLDNTRANKTIKYTPEDSALFVSGFIVGGSGLGKGWNELKFKPGIYAKTALRFDFGRFNEVVSAIEIGLSADFYSDKIPQMLFQKEKQFFYQGHISVMFGHRK